MKYETKCFDLRFNVTKEAKLFSEEMQEVQRARKIHPLWPDHPHAAFSNITEEFLEAQQELNDIVNHGNGNVQALREELIQTKAMITRFLVETAIFDEVAGIKK